MNQTPCNIIRDLMPLCIDRAASEESSALVETHIAECEDCRTCYEKMRGELPKTTREQAQAENTAFGHAAELMKIKRRLRTGKNILLGILIGCLLVFGSLFSIKVLYNEHNAELPVTAYDVSLSQLKDGRVVINMDYKGTNRPISPAMMTGHQVTPKSKNSSIATISVNTTIIPRKTDINHTKGPFLFLLRDIDQYAAIYAGKNNQKLIWKSGDAISAASDEMEAYYALEKQMRLYTAGIFDASFEGPSDQQFRQTDEINARLKELRAKVPEWQ